VPLMRRYRLIGQDAKDQQPFDETVAASNKAVAQVMLLAQLCQNVATAQVAGHGSPAVPRAARMAASLGAGRLIVPAVQDR